MLGLVSEQAWAVQLGLASEQAWAVQLGLVPGKRVGQGWAAW